MAESYRHIDKRVIFRETFESESTMRANGWSLTGQSFNNSELTIGTQSNNYAGRPLKLKTKTYTVRLLFKVNDITSGAEILNFSYGSSVSHSCRIFIHATTKLLGVWCQPGPFIGYTKDFTNDRNWHEIIVTSTATTLTVYLDGVFNSTAANTLTQDLKNITLGAMNRSGIPWGGSSYKLLEIYKDALTAIEIKNLYNNTTYHVPTLPAPVFYITTEKGVIEERTNKIISVTSTSPKVTNSPIHGMQFIQGVNGINCGVDPIGLGDVTISVWEKIMRNVNGISTSYGWSFSNGKCALNHSIAPGNYYSITSDGFSTGASSATGSFKLGKITNIIVTRKSSGKASFYINGILSGALDQNSAITVPNSYLCVGDAQTGSVRMINGFIYSMKVYPGILTPEQISQLYTDEKVKYK
jgi:hypothetical protein